MTTYAHAYIDAWHALISAQNEFWHASIAELQRLMPDHVDALIFTVNDTPRLAFDAYVDVDGVEHFAEEIDEPPASMGGSHAESPASITGHYAPTLYDFIDLIAANLEVHHPDDAASWLFSHEDGERFTVERD